MIQKFDPFVRNDYPSRDGRPFAETDWHREAMANLIRGLKAYYAPDPDTYVSGNLLIFYKPNDKRRHVSPDVFVVRGVRHGTRPNYLVWQEGKAPDVVIELTSKTTRREDIATKMALYRDTLKVKEYFLFDPLEEYLDPSMQGYRLVGGVYRRIREKDGRLPSRGAIATGRGASATGQGVGQTGGRGRGRERPASQAPRRPRPRQERPLSRREAPLPRRRPDHLVNQPPCSPPT